MDIKPACETCDNCGLCCKNWDIELSKEDVRKLVHLGYDTSEFLELKPVPRMRMVSSGNDRKCIFLDDKNMCVLQKSHGKEAKPHTCRQYPQARPPKPGERDYFFYEYGGKTITRDVLVRMLGHLKRTSMPYLFEMLLDELEILKKQSGKYVDFFNYDDTRHGSGLGRSLSRRRIKRLATLKFRDDDREEFGKIKKRDGLDVRKLIGEIQKGIPTESALNHNLPDMLLAYFYILGSSEPKEAKALADYFFHWNGKRF